MPSFKVEVQGKKQNLPGREKLEGEGGGGEVGIYGWGMGVGMREGRGSE